MLNVQERQAMIRGMYLSLDLMAYRRLLTLINQERGAKAKALAGLKPQDILPRSKDKRPTIPMLTTLVERWALGGEEAVSEALDAIIRAAKTRTHPSLLTLQDHLFPPATPEEEEELDPPDTWDDATQAIPKDIGIDDMMQAAIDAEEWKEEHTRVVDPNLWSKLDISPADIGSSNQPRGYTLGEGEGEFEPTSEGTLGHLLAPDALKEEGQEPTTFTPGLSSERPAPAFPGGDATQFLLELEVEEEPPTASSPPPTSHSLRDDAQAPTLHSSGPIDLNATPSLREVVYLPHRQRQGSGGLVELSFSGVPEGLHALRLTGSNLDIGGTLAFEGIRGERGVDFRLDRDAYFFFNMEELSPLLHRRVRFRTARGLETQPLPIFVSQTESSHGVIPQTPPGAAWIPPGTYRLPKEGGPPQDTHCQDGLFLSIHPVSHGEFERFLMATHFKPKNNTDFLRQARDGRFPAALSDHPVVYVSHGDARAYAQWVGGRLPTEEEWMRAAVGLDGRPFPWGEHLDLSRMNTREARIGWTTPRGTYPEGQGPFGHQDLLGNIWEWTRTEVPGTDPVQRVIKGGGWVNGHPLATPGTRSIALPQTRQFYLGFRVAWDKGSIKGDETQTIS